MKLFTSLFSRPENGVQHVQSNSAETSMNFDSDNVRPFLDTLNANAAGTVDASALTAVDRALNTMGVDDTRDVLLNADTGLQLQIFMDDIQAPDLYFFGSPDVITYIDQVFFAFAAALGI